VVKLIRLFHTGSGIETLVEANNLLQAIGFRDLQPDEIDQINPA
jgi:hypothetical protein